MQQLCLNDKIITPDTNISALRHCDAHSHKKELRDDLRKFWESTVIYPQLAKRFFTKASINTQQQTTTHINT